MSSSWGKEEQDFAPWDEVQCDEGEEHLCGLVAVEAPLLVLPSLATDTRVPGRLRGRHLEYEALGAEPYIVSSKCRFVQNIFGIFSGS